MAYTDPGYPSLRLHPDGHWMPNTPGRWLWRSPDFVEGRSEPSLCEVFARDGGLMVRQLPDTGHYDSIRMAPKGTWEWVPPTEDEP